MQKNRFSDIIQIFKYKLLWRKYQTNTLLIITIRRIIIICVNRDLDLFDESKFEIFFTDAKQRNEIAWKTRIIKRWSSMKIDTSVPAIKKKKGKEEKSNCGSALNQSRFDRSNSDSDRDAPGSGRRGISG